VLLTPEQPCRALCLGARPQRPGWAEVGCDEDGNQEQYFSVAALDRLPLFGNVGASKPDCMGSAGVGSVFRVMVGKPDDLVWPRVKLVFFLYHSVILDFKVKAVFQKTWQGDVLMLACFLALVRGDLEQNQYMSFR